MSEMSAQTTITQPVTDLRNSRVGKRPVELPKGVTVQLAKGKIDIKGPKGTLSRELPPTVDVKVEGPKISVHPLLGGRATRLPRQGVYPGAEDKYHLCAVRAATPVNRGRQRPQPAGVLAPVAVEVAPENEHRHRA